MWKHIVGALILSTCQFVSAEEENHNSNNQGNGFSSSAEAQLVQQQMARYMNKKSVRPVINASHPVMVQFGIGLIQILDFNQKDQTLSTLVWKRYVWHDEVLGWDPAQHDNIQSIMIPCEKVWTPDIVLYNNVGSSDVEKHNNLLVVEHTGNITWIPPVKYQSSCAVDMTDFPFDEQICELRFGPWVYNIMKINIFFYDGVDQFDLTEYLPHSEWDIVDNYAIKRVQKYPCCAEKFADMLFRVRLQRKVTFHMRLILIPTVLLSLMSAAIFWIPPNRPDRTSLGLSLFSSFFLLLIIVVNSSPPTAAARLGTYYIVIILLVSVGVLYSVLIINVFQSQNAMPMIIEKIFLDMFGCIVCGGQQKSVSHTETTSPLHPLRQNDSAFSGHEKHYGRKCTKTQNADKWKRFASVVDRLFFLIFLATLIISFTCIFPKPWLLITV